MSKIILALACTLFLAGGALAQTSTTTSLYSGLEGYLYDGMTTEQQNQYNAIQTYVNFSTQVVTMAFYKQVEKKYERGDVLNSYEASVLARGPMAITSGNTAFVTVGAQ